MYELFFTHLNQKLQLTEEEQALFKTHLIFKKLRKRQYILQEGDVSRYHIFVEKGLLRSYAVDEKGIERIVQFAPEGWWISDLYSFITGEPSTLNIDALEPCELVLISKNSAEALQTAFPQYLAFSFHLIQNAYVALQRRMFDMMHLTNEEKYTKLMNTCPTIVQRVPQHMIASAIGITPEALSRVRKRLAEQKQNH